MDICRQHEPSFADTGGGHRVACFLYDQVQALNEKGEPVSA